VAALEHITRDLRYLQHPLVVLLFLVAGARLELSTPLAGLVVAYMAFRMAGKLAGGWLASVVAMPALPRDVGLSLISPGVVGIAIALNVFQALGMAETSASLFMIVTAGSLGSEVLSLLISRTGHST
jgi:hypothetical protein